MSNVWLYLFVVPCNHLTREGLTVRHFDSVRAEIHGIPSTSQIPGFDRYLSSWIWGWFLILVYSVGVHGQSSLRSKLRGRYFDCYRSWLLIGWLVCCSWHVGAGSGCSYWHYLILLTACGLSNSWILVMKHFNSNSPRSNFKYEFQILQSLRGVNNADFGSECPFYALTWA